MARLRYNGLATTLGAALSAADTTITFSGALTHSGGTAVPTLSGSDYIPLTILDVNGAVSEIVSLTAYTSGATTGTIARAREGTAAATHATGASVIHSSTVLDFGSGGGILARTSYNPATIASYTINSATPADVDATNLAVTFTAPDSGEVLVRLEAVGGSGGTTNDNLLWSLREGTTTVAGPAMVDSGGTDQAANDALSRTFHITGLTPGTAYTYKWGWRTATVAATASRLYAGGLAGPATMEVYDASPAGTGGGGGASSSAGMSAQDAFGPLLGRLTGGQPVTWLNFGDSLSDETWDWPYEVTRRIAALFPTHATQVAPHNGTAWQTPTVITSGGGATVQFTMANAAVAGYDSATWQSKLSTVTPTYSPDVITITLGHNDDPVTERANYEALVDAVIAAYPDVPVVLVVQNPNQFNSDQTTRRAYILSKASSSGIASTDTVWWALGGPRPITALYNSGDAVHLTTAGIAAWKNAILREIGLTTDEAAPSNVIDIATRAAGDLTISSATFVAVDTGLDLTVRAVAGDVLDVSLGAIVSGRNTGSFDNNLNFTAFTRLAGADVNNIGGTGSVPGWFAPDRLVTIAGRQFYTVQAGDIDTSGNITLRLYVKTDDTTSQRTLFANAGNPMQFAVRNLGPAA